MISDLNVLIYCDLVTTQLVGSEIAHLLRTIVCPSQLGKHQFSKIFYLPVEYKTFWSIHIEKTILNQTKPIVYFSADDKNKTIPTKVVLHVRRTKWEKLPLGNYIICPQYAIDKVNDSIEKRGIKQILVHWKGFPSELTVGYVRYTYISMEIHRNQLYVTLFSNASKEVFPDNT